MSLFSFLKAKVSSSPPMSDEAITAALQLDYEGFTFSWQASWAYAGETGRLVIRRHGVTRQFGMERPRSVKQLLSTVRTCVLDWVWQDFTEVAGLKRELRT